MRHEALDPFCSHAARCSSPLVLPWPRAPGECQNTEVPADLFRANPSQTSSGHEDPMSALPSFIAGLELSHVLERGAYLTRLYAVDGRGVWVPLQPARAYDVLGRREEKSR